MTKASLFFLLGSLLSGVVHGGGLRKTYIVQLRDTQAPGITRRSSVDSSLQAVSANAASVLYTYENVLNGYAAKITDDQANALRKQPDVLSVSLDKLYHLHTSRSPAFLGLEDSALLGSGYGAGSDAYHKDANGTAAESNLVIGVFDTGVWPENPSYNDAGMPPIPAHWKGECETASDFPSTSCNKKLIGARSFYKGYLAELTNGTGLYNWTEHKSARDDDGHGTHTSTTAAGAEVPNVSLFGQASGTVRGMAPGARIAMYKVCWEKGCFNSDILAAMDKAIVDGVNVMSLSLGSDTPYFGEGDALVVGSYSAVQKGIFVSVSAGNSGPGAGSVTASSPWILTVGASSIDRNFPAHVNLGNGKSYAGISLYSNGSVSDVKPLAPGDVLPLIHGSHAGKGNVSAATLCEADSLDPAKVSGKIVVCLRGDNARVAKGANVKAAGGRGMVLVNAPVNGNDLEADAHLLPAVHLTSSDGAEVAAYAETGSGTASMVFDGTRVGIPAPIVAGFSSRGPNLPLPQINKPDITGPGVSILAGWGSQGPTGQAVDTRRVNYNVISGTSMSCPHLSGIALFIMARRPQWSPASIRSAIMTTAYTNTKGTNSPFLDSFNNKPSTPFISGSGHVDPVAALDPGLIYDISPKDYRNFLCAVDPTPDFITGITRSDFACNSNRTYSAYDLNYPSLSVLYNNPANGTYTAKLKRTVTNVGDPSTYKVDVSLNDPELVKVSVEPTTLSFKKVGEERSYVVTVTMSSPPSWNATSWGRLVWSDATHVVGSALTFVWGIDY